MNDKDKLYLNACLYAIDKLVEKGSRSYCFKTDDGWHSVTWGYTIGWILEKLNAESDKLKADDELLDKIRAEIENTLSDGMIHKKTVLGIIDKYKAESEEK